MWKSPCILSSALWGLAKAWSRPWGRGNGRGMKKHPNRAYELLPVKVIRGLIDVPKLPVAIRSDQVFGHVLQLAVELGAQCSTTGDTKGAPKKGAPLLGGKNPQILQAWRQPAQHPKGARRARAQGEKLGLVIGTGCSKNRPPPPPPAKKTR